MNSDEKYDEKPQNGHIEEQPTYFKAEIEVPVTENVSLLLTSGRIFLTIFCLVA